MSIFVVLALSMSHLAEPFGVYSSLPMATLAMVKCEHEHDQCEIWEWTLDGAKVHYAPEYPEGDHDELVSK